MSFWTSGSGKMITGKPEEAFLQDFTVIPEGTIADAFIKSFFLIERENKWDNNIDKFYEITYKLINGDFKNREVTQKIKCFAGSPEAIDRNLNMLRLVMELCEFKPTTKEAPGDLELLPMFNKVISVKIREWSMPKRDGSGIMEGNFVSEIYKTGEIAPETGIKTVATHFPTDSALNRNSKLADVPDDEIPF